jgi:hypothetical protein
MYIVQYTYISTFIHDTGKKCCKEEGVGHGRDGGKVKQGRERSLGGKNC